MSAWPNNETLGEFRARRSAENHAAQWERLRWYGLIAMLVMAVAVLCILSAVGAVWIDRMERDPVVVLEHKGACQPPKSLNEMLRDRLRRK